MGGGGNMYDSFAQVSLLSSFFFLLFLSYFLSFSFLLFFLSSFIFIFLLYFFISYFGWAKTKMDSTCITHLQVMSPFFFFFFLGIFSFLSLFLLTFSSFSLHLFPFSIFFFFSVLLSFLSSSFFIAIYFVWAKTRVSERTRRPCSCQSSHRVRKMYRKRH